MQALDLSVNLMEKGEKSIIQADSKYTYGEDGKPPLIPPNSTLLYEVEIKGMEQLWYAWHPLMIRC